MVSGSMSIIKQQFAVIHRYTILQQRGKKKTQQILNGQTRKHVMFLRKYTAKQFGSGRNILTEGVFGTQLSTNAGFSV